MNIMRSVLLGAAALVFSTAAFAQVTVKIGITGPLTGGSAPLGTSIRDGVKLAVSEINAKGGVGGRKIELIERDVTLLCVTAQSPKTVTLHAPRESERMAVPGSRQRPCRLRAHGIRSGRHAGEDRQ